ncbi:MAG: lipopolysaccharide biosynthesis protein [Lentisphaerae bacterium]|nr:lipopolysaccharide biosynthesis protein [Lentisphaerota bacterium]
MPQDAKTNAAPRHAPAARGVIFLSSAELTALALGSAIHMVGARMLDAGSYARLVLAISIAAWFKIPVANAIVSSFPKILSEDHSRLGDVLRRGGRAYALAVAAIFAVFLASSPAISGIFGDRALLPVLLVAACEVPFAGGLSFSRNVLTAIRRYASASAILFTYALVRTTAAVLLIVAGFGTLGAMTGQAAGAAAAAILGTFLVLAARAGTEATDEYPELMRRSAAWSALALPTSMAIATIAGLDLWFAKCLTSDPTGLALYGAAFALSRISIVSAGGLSASVFPRVSSALAQDDAARARSVAAESLRLLALMFLPAVLLTAAAAPGICALVFSPPYSAAAPYLVILMAAAAATSTLALAVSLLGATNRPGRALVLAVSTLAAATPVTFFATRSFGLTGAAFAALASQSVGAVAGILAVRRELPFRVPVLSFLRAAAAASCAAAPGFAISATGFAAVVELAVMSAIYLFLLVALGELRREDAASFFSAIFRK